MKALLSVLEKSATITTELSYKKRLQKLDTFIHANVNNVGTHPFLVGLKRALKANLHSANVVGWEITDLVFTESGGEAFMQYV